MVPEENTLAIRKMIIQTDWIKFFITVSPLGKGCDPSFEQT